jgi:plastocyanin
MTRMVSALIAAWLLVAPLSGRAASDHRVVALSATYYSQNGSGTITVAQGDSVTFTNLDPPTPYGSSLTLIYQVHSLTENAASPRFGTLNLVGFGGSANVVGVNTLAPGTYQFHCTRHIYMHGTLIVT